jgi:hypothetical protein
VTHDFQDINNMFEMILAKFIISLPNFKIACMHTEMVPKRNYCQKLDSVICLPLSINNMKQRDLSKQDRKKRKKEKKEKL